MLTTVLKPFNQEPVALAFGIQFTTAHSISARDVRRQSTSQHHESETGQHKWDMEATGRMLIYSNHSTDDEG